MNKQEMKKEIVERCNYLFANDTPLRELIEIEIKKVLDSGYIDYENYDFEEDGYQLMKLINYLALKRVSDSFKPLDTNFMKKYKSLIRNY